MSALERIYNNLQNGMQYGRRVYNVRFPYFQHHLLLSPDKKYIRWIHYGESANKNTINDLRWIIETIFKTTPEEFEKNHSIKMEG